jgi:Lon protease-like protein
MKKIDLPKKIPVFPLSNFIIFPKTTVPLNIFEPRYIEMINESMKKDKLVGMIQPRNSNEDTISPALYDIGCLGKITSFKETDDGRYLIELKGLIRFQILKEVNSNLKFSDLELIFKNFKSLFEKRGFIINWKELEKQSLDETINALAMASPFSLEEKQVLLEAKNLDMRKDKITKILSTYSYDVFNNTTIQ